MRNPNLVEANWMPREEAARALDVRVNLLVQLQRRAELLFTAQQVVKVQPDDIAVNVGIEIEDVTLDGQRVGRTPMLVTLSNERAKLSKRDVLT